MTSDALVARRYAKALFEVAREKQAVREVEAELKSVIGVLDGHEDLERFLNHPNIAASSKIELLQKIFSGQVREEIINTFRLLIERRREGLLRSLHGHYVNIANEALGQADAEVATAVPLTDEEVRAVGEKFSQLTGKTVRVHNIVKPDILGGIQVQIGDRLYDASLAGKLSRLQKQLQQNQAL